MKNDGGIQFPSMEHGRIAVLPSNQPNSYNDTVFSETNYVYY